MARTWPVIWKTLNLTLSAYPFNWKPIHKRLSKAIRYRHPIPGSPHSAGLIPVMTASAFLCIQRSTSARSTKYSMRNFATKNSRRRDFLLPLRTSGLMVPLLASPSRWMWKVMLTERFTWVECRGSIPSRTRLVSQILISVSILKTH